MEHDRVVVLEDGRIEDTRLTERNPLFDRRVGDDTLCLRFGQTIVVISRYADRVASTSPMQRLATVAHLCHTTDINNLGLFVLSLSEHSVTDISSRSDIGAEGSLRTVVCLWRYHTTNVKNYISTRNTTEDIIVVGKVAPNNF